MGTVAIHDQQNLFSAGLNRHQRRAELARMRCAARKAKKRTRAQ